MKRILRDERGMALAVAIFALVVVGALVAGAFFAGTQEQRVGENQRRVQTSFGAAEAGVQERVISWKPDSMNKRNAYPQDSVPIYSVSAQGSTPGGTGRYFGYSYKLGNNIFLIDVTGECQRPARRRRRCAPAHWDDYPSRTSRLRDPCVTHDTGWREPVR